MNLLKNKFQILSAIFFGMIGCYFLSCETPINPTLQSAAPVLVVDAWINNKPEKQTVLLTWTQPYFDDAQPTGVSGATVSVLDVTDGTSYTFSENPSVKGSYEWTPSSGSFGTIGHSYQLTIAVNLTGNSVETFVASSRMGRVPPIDSITFELDQNVREKNKFRYIGEFWATDPTGVGDTYWIKTTENDTLLNLPSEINIAYDAGLSAGGDADGVTFLLPIRRRISPDRSNSSTDKSPFNIGDTVYVEINSITLAAFNYLGQVVTQTNRPGGFGELFATPLANVSTNITNTNTKGSNVVGFFNTAAVSGRGARFTKVN